MISRRHILTAFAASPFALAPLRSRAAGIIDLDWGDLVPEGDTGTLLKTLRQMGVVQHGQLSTGFDQEEARAVTSEYDGETVRLPGFIVPLDFDGTGVTAFILAPFVGACIHVPPPPANQLVLVTTDTPYEYEGLYDAVYVTGTFGTASIGTLLAEVGYTMAADKIVPYS